MGTRLQNYRIQRNFQNHLVEPHRYIDKETETQRPQTEVQVEKLRSKHLPDSADCEASEPLSTKLSVSDASYLEKGGN